MPGFDGRGPTGAGPLTGWGRGLCNPYPYGGWALCYRGLGRGAGRGLGFRRVGLGIGRPAGYGRRFMPGQFYQTGVDRYQSPTPEDEVAALRREAEFLKQDLDAVNSRISELESKNSKP